MPHRMGLSDGELAVWRAFLDMRRRLDITLERRLQSDADLTVAEFSVLSILLEAPGEQLRVGEIAAALAWEKSRVSHQVSRMERRGLVERRMCNTDARGTWVGLTEAGSTAVVSAIRPHTDALREYFFDVLSPQQLASIGDASVTLLGGLRPCSVEAIEAKDPDDAVVTA